MDARPCSPLRFDVCHVTLSIYSIHSHYQKNKLDTSAKFTSLPSNVFALTIRFHMRFWGDFKLVINLHKTPIALDMRLVNEPQTIFAKPHQ